MIPDYQSLMRPVLECASEGPLKISEAVERISEKLNLTDDEKQKLLPSGKQTVIANRVHWAKSYLKQADLVTGERRGWYGLTAEGASALADDKLVINSKFLQRFEKFQDFQNRSRSDATSESANLARSEDSNLTPEEELLEAHKNLENNLAASLLASVRDVTPEFFEKIIVSLFIAMGYGGSHQGAGRQLGRSGDNGVDGVIDQDPLGVDQIYLQAKRYNAKNTVSSGEIRDFFGALSIQKAQKGIFVTTSSFSPSALQTAKDLGQRIVLIDGERLTDLMIKYQIGCSTTNTLFIKSLDEVYFEEGEKA